MSESDRTQEPDVLELGMMVEVEEMVDVVDCRDGVRRKVGIREDRRLGRRSARAARN